MECQIFTWKDIAADNLLPSDFIVTHGSGFFDKLIQFFTMSQWNHAALIIDKQGTIVELVEQGIKKHHIGKYRNQQIYVVRVPMSDDDRAQVVTYATTMLSRHETYGFLTIASIVFKIITHFRLIVKLDGTQICSEFIANALSQGGIIWDKDASLVTPADLYNRFVMPNT